MMGKDRTVVCAMPSARPYTREQACGSLEALKGLRKMLNLFHPWPAQRLTDKVVARKWALGTRIWTILSCSCRIRPPETASPMSSDGSRKVLTEVGGTSRVNSIGLRGRGSTARSPKSAPTSEARVVWKLPAVARTPVQGGPSPPAGQIRAPSAHLSENPDGTLVGTPRRRSATAGGPPLKG